MSRTAAKKALQGRNLHAELEKQGITLIGSGLDEAADAYKSITEVLEHQTNLVKTTARLDPLVVRMAGR